jgi:hypothetical protein
MKSIHCRCSALVELVCRSGLVAKRAEIQTLGSAHESHIILMMIMYLHVSEPTRLIANWSDFRSIKKAVEGFKGRNVPLHGLINNAGVGAPKGQAGQQTSEGIEVHNIPLYNTSQALVASRSDIPNYSNC